MKDGVNVPTTKDYDPVSGETEPHNDADSDEDADEELDAYAEQRDVTRELVNAEPTGRQWHEVMATLESITFATQVADRGCLVRTISWKLRQSVVPDDGGYGEPWYEWSHHETTTWVPGVTLEYLKAQPEEPA